MKSFKDFLFQSLYKRLEHGESTAVFEYKNNADIERFSNLKFINLVIYILNLLDKSNETILFYGDKTIESIALMIACLLKGKTFAPLNPNLDNNTLFKVKSQLSGHTFISIDKALWKQSPIYTATSKQLLDYLTEFHSSFDSKSNLAYIIFTSGTTGTPKGVQIRRESLYIFIHYLRDKLNIHPANIQLSLSPTFFDNFIFDLSIFIANQSPILVSSALEFIDTFDFCKESNVIKSIDFVYAAPSIIRRLMNKGFFEFYPRNQPFFVGFGGEPFSWTSTDILLTILPSNSRIISFYGPSECTCMCSCFEIDLKKYEETKEYYSQYSSNLPIGKIFDYFNFLIINQESNMRGELVLSGNAVMTGYLADKQKGFVTIDNQKYYKTGDIVSFDANQNLCIHGRSDNQLKILGNRVELEEIESNVKSILNDANIILIALEDRGMPRIILIRQSSCTKGIDPQLDLDPNELKHLNAINSKLPNNMRISDCLLVEEFKLTENGKMNKKYYLEAVKVFLKI